MKAKRQVAPVTRNDQSDDLAKNLSRTLLGAANRHPCLTAAVEALTYAIEQENAVEAAICGIRFGRQLALVTQAGPLTNDIERLLPYAEKSMKAVAAMNAANPKTIPEEIKQAAVAEIRRLVLEQNIPLENARRRVRAKTGISLRTLQGWVTKKSLAAL